MTDQPIDPEVHVQRPGDGGLTGSIAPEGVAGVLAIVAVVVLLAARLAFAGGTGAVPTPRPTPAFTPGPTIAPGSAIAGTIATLRQVNANLDAARTDLVVALKAPQLDVGVARPTMAAIHVQLLTGVHAAAVLAADPAGSTVGAELGVVYQELDNAVAAVQQVNVQDLAKWRAGTQAVVDILTRIQPFDGLLSALLVGPGPAVSPSGSPLASASPSAPSSTPPSETPSTEPTAPPSPSPSPSASVVPSASPGPNVIVDPGFETGVGPPWMLVLNDPAAGASVSGDASNPHGGATSARIDISAAPGRQSAISFQQGNIVVEAGAQYRVTLWARTATSRGIRVRVTTSTGQTLGNGTSQFTLGPTWSLLTFDFSSILGTDSAILAIEAGQSAESIWIDDVGIARIPPGAP